MTEQSISEIYKNTRLLSARLMTDWLKSRGILEMLSRPETIPGLFYQNKWPNEPKSIVEKIFQFLTSLNYLTEASGTFIKSDENDRISALLDGIDLVTLATHPAHNFVKYGLKLLDLKFDWDAGLWNLDTDQFTFERGITQDFYQELAEPLKELIKSNIEFAIGKSPKTLLMSQYPENFMTHLIELPVGEIDIVVPNELLSELAITFSELIPITSKFSNHIVKYTQFLNNQLSTKYDLIVLVNCLGFDFEFKEWLNQIKSHSKADTVIYGFAPTEPKYFSGIEVFFETHPQYKGLPGTNDFARQFKARGFHNIKRCGPNDLFFVTKYVG